MNSSRYPLPIWPASQAEIICASQKDDQYHHHWMEEQTQEILQKILGTRRWLGARDTISSVSRFAYYAFTTLSGLQTPGEEYTNTLLITSTTTGQIYTPSLWHRLLVVTLQAFDSEILKYSSRQLSKFTENNTNHPWTKYITNTLGSDRLDSKFIEEKLSLIHKAHLIAFFLFGNYYHLTKRLTNTSYVVNNSSVHFAQRFEIFYKIIGLLSLVQLLANLKEMRKDKSDISEGNSSTKQISSLNQQKTMGDSSKMMCSLCMEPRQHSTSTLCGHLYCWDCIHQWLKYKRECAVCRNQVEPSRLIILNNFYP